MSLSAFAVRKPLLKDNFSAATNFFSSLNNIALLTYRLALRVGDRGSHRNLKPIMNHTYACFSLAVCLFSTRFASVAAGVIGEDAQEVAAPGYSSLDASAADNLLKENSAFDSLDRNSTNYRLGPEDSLLIRIEHADEIGTAPYSVDLNGQISLPRIGTVKAAGCTVLDVQNTIARRFSRYLIDPVVIVSISEYRSQPVSVLGEVGSPGIHQVRGRRGLVEILSEAGGLKPTAGDDILLTREIAFGELPLAGAKKDRWGKFTTGEISIHSLMEANNPGVNIPVMPHDIILVPKAKLIFVIGAVHRPGGFTLTDRKSVSIVEAISMAEGLDRTAGSSKAVIMRVAHGATTRQEIPVDIKKIMLGKTADVALSPNDILYVPTSASKNASVRILEAVIQTGTGVATYGRF